MSKKFDKDRSVSVSYAKVPLYYTNIKHPENKHKELILMDRIGNSYTACWRNNKTDKVGMEFIVKATANGFLFKDKEYKIKNCNRVI